MERLASLEKWQFKINKIACLVFSISIALSFCDGVGLFFVGSEIERMAGINASYLSIVLAPFAIILFLLKGKKVSVSGVRLFSIFCLWVLLSSSFSTNDPQELALIRTLMLIGFALALLMPINFIFLNDALFVYRSASLLIINISIVCMVIQAFEFFYAAEGFTVVQPLFSIGNYPRFSGAFGDPNRCGIFFGLLLFLNSVVMKSRDKAHILFLYYFLPALMIVLTLSRTGLLVALLFWIYCHCVFPSRKLVFFTCVLSLFAFLLYFFLGLQGAFFNSDQRSESNIQHLNAFVLGLNSIFYSSMSPLIGNGWGTSYAFVGDIFDDSRYGNFHSGLVTILSSFGIPFFVVFLIFLLKISHFKNRITSFFVLFLFLCVNLIYDFLSLGIFSLMILAGIISRNRFQQC